MSRKTTKTEAPANGKCLCGCGRKTRPKSRFLQGHDAKLKSLLLKVQRGDEPISSLPKDSLPFLRQVGVAGLKVRNTKAGLRVVAGGKRK